MTNILFISHSSEFQGAEKALHHIVRNLDHEMFRPFVVVPNGGPLIERLESAGARVLCLPVEHWVFLPHATPEQKAAGIRGIRRRAGRLADVIRGFGIDIVHTNSSAVMDGAIASQFARKPHVWYLVEPLGNGPYLHPVCPLADAYEYIRRMSDVVVANSDYLRQWAGAYMRPNGPITIKTGIDVSIYRPPGPEDRARARSALSAGDRPVIALVGAFTEHKGYEHLPGIVQAVARAIPDILFIAAGRRISGAVIDRVETSAANAGIGKHIRLAPDMEDVRTLYHAADLFLHLSPVESYPTVILEAIASGLPVVTADCGGAEESVRNGDCGVVVPPGDIAAFSREIVSIVTDGGRLRGLSANARAHHTSFDGARLGGAFQSVYAGMRRGARVNRGDGSESVLSALESQVAKSPELPDHWLQLANMLNRCSSAGKRVAIYGAGAHTAGMLRNPMLDWSRLVRIYDGFPAGRPPRTDLQGRMPEPLNGTAEDIDVIVISSRAAEAEIARRLRRTLKKSVEIYTIYQPNMTEGGK